MLVSALVNSVNLSGSAARLNQLKSLLFPHQVLFFHVPKCGGTALSHAFRVRYVLSHFRLHEEVSAAVINREEVERWWEYKRHLFLYHALSGTNFVQGHVQYDPAAFAGLHGRAVFLTLLREPKDRVISHYYFDSRTNCMSFREFLQSHRGQVECSVLSRFFGGLPFSAGMPAETHRDAAIEALRRFDIVGLLEAPDQMAAAIRKRTGLKFDLPVRNVGAQRRASDQHISTEDMALLEEMCEFETAIYEAARERALSL